MHGLLHVHMHNMKCMACMFLLLEEYSIYYGSSSGYVCRIIASGLVNIIVQLCIIQ